MMPSNSGSSGSQQPATSMIPSGSDPHLPSRPMQSGGSQSHGQTPNRPLPSSGSDLSRPMQSLGSPVQPQTPNRPSGGDPQTQPPVRPTQTHPTRPGRPPVTQQVLDSALQIG